MFYIRCAGGHRSQRHNQKNRILPPTRLCQKGPAVQYSSTIGYGPLTSRSGEGSFAMSKSSRAGPAVQEQDSFRGPSENDEWKDTRSEGHRVANLCAHAFTSTLILPLQREHAHLGHQVGPGDAAEAADGPASSEAIPAARMAGEEG